MAYITAQEVKAIREELKAQFPKFKFGVRKSSGSLAVDVTIKSGPTDFSDIFRESDRAHAQINQYWLSNYGDHAEFFGKIIDIMKTAPAKASGRAWFDESDAMTDYFHTAYYMHLEVGSWNAPYIQVK